MDQKLVGIGHITDCGCDSYAAFAAGHSNGLATANLVVDQHVGSFGEFEFPILTKDDSLSVAKIALETHREDVPMVKRQAFDPPQQMGNLRYALPEVASGVDQIIQAVRQHSDAANAALQMAGVLADHHYQCAKAAPRFPLG